MAQVVEVDLPCTPIIGIRSTPDSPRRDRYASRKCQSLWPFDVSWSGLFYSIGSDGRGWFGFPSYCRYTGLGVGVQTAEPAPIHSNWPKNPTNWPCYAMPSYACTQGGYDNKSALASGWPKTPPRQRVCKYYKYRMHNCTLYAAYRLKENGFEKPRDLGKREQLV